MAGNNNELGLDVGLPTEFDVPRHLDPAQLEDGWSIKQHTDMGELKLTRVGDDLFANGEKIELFLSPDQLAGKAVPGSKFRFQIRGKALPATVLSVLKQNPKLIPARWKRDRLGKRTDLCFWGTIFQDGIGEFVLRLSWDEHWDPFCDQAYLEGRTEGQWTASAPTPVLAS